MTSETALVAVDIHVAKEPVKLTDSPQGAEPVAASPAISDEYFWASFAVANHRAAIFAAYGSGLGPILETASACLEGEKNLDPVQKSALLKDLPFSKATFSKYVSIGRDSRLYDPEIRKKSPPKFTVLYLLSGLSNEDFTALLQHGIFRPGLRRGELEQWIKIRGEFKIGKPKLTKLARAFAAGFRPASALSVDREEEFRRRLEKLGAEFGMEVVFPTDRYMTDWDQAVLYIREQGRKVVDHFVSQKRQIVKSYGGKVPSHIRKNPAAAYGDIWIGPTDDIDRVQAVLAHIGREKEFELIRAAAFQAYVITEVREETSTPQEPSSRMAADETLAGDDTRGEEQEHSATEDASSL